MPIPGKHRRPKSSTIARGIVVASAGGAVIALPLLGATGANAAEQAAPATAQSAAATHSTPAKPVADKQSGTTTYSVVSGDYLSKIAAQHKVKGGWEKLYQDNRKVVGDNPSLIFPGMKLTLGGKAWGHAPATGSHTSTGDTTPSKAPRRLRPRPSRRRPRPPTPRPPPTPRRPTPRRPSRAPPPATSTRSPATTPPPTAPPAPAGPAAATPASTSPSPPAPA